MAPGPVVIEKVIIGDNSQNGIYKVGNGTLHVLGSLIHKSVVNGIDCQVGSVSVESSTLADNGGWGVQNAGLASILNSIAWGNVLGGLSDCNTVEYSNSQEVQAGTGNLNIDPLFVNPGADNYRLSYSPMSPCRDAGNNQAWMDDARDLAGNPRILPKLGVVDMGAYELTMPASGTIIRTR